MTRKWDALAQEILAPALHIPSSPLTLAGFGMHATQSASSLVKCVFRGQRARALFAGLAAHSIVALDQPGTSAIGLALAAAGHTHGWPIPRGGSQQIYGGAGVLAPIAGGNH